jgi:hypothetical protein
MLRLQQRLSHRQTSTLVAFLVFATSAIVIVEAVAQQPERLLGFQDSDGKLTFRVPSHGCTSKDDFEVSVSPHSTETRQVTVGLIRKNQDNCKGFFREGAEIRFTRQELGLSDNVAVKPENLQNPAFDTKSR